MKKKDEIIDCINYCINNNYNLIITQEYYDSIIDIEYNTEDLALLKMSIKFYYEDDLRQGRNKIVKYKVLK